MREALDALASKAAAGECYASFGKLLQGVLPDGSHFLVTLPIDLCARAHFSASRHANTLEISLADSWKTLQLVRALLRRYDLPMRGIVHLEGAIPRGKGLVSSTADLVAVYQAVAKWHGLARTRNQPFSLDPVDFAQIVAAQRVLRRPVDDDKSLVQPRYGRQYELRATDHGSA